MAALSTPFLILLIALSTGCSPGQSNNQQSGAPTPTAAPAAQTTFTPDQAARDAVAARLQVDVAFTEIVSSRAFDFPDSSLGCPQPGMAYVQAITPGQRVLVRMNGEQYDVRVSGSRALICDQKVLRNSNQTRNY